MPQLPFLQWLPEWRQAGTVRADLLAGLTGAALGNLGGPWLAGAVFDRSGSYQGVIWACVVLSALATLCTMRAVSPRRQRAVANLT